MDIELFLSHFEDVKASGTGYRAKCPTHDDRTPSLSISECADGKILIWCHSRCETADVLEAVGLSPRDLYPDSSSFRERKNRSQNPADVTSKTEPAQPLSEAKIGLGRAHNKYLLDNFERLTFDLPWTVEAIKAAGAGFDVLTDRFVFIIRNLEGDVVNLKHHKGSEGQPPFSIEGHGQNCLYPAQLIRKYDSDCLLLVEGEKDAVTAISQGFQALTGTTGVKSVVADLTSLSKFRKIFIIFDNDEAGRDGAIMWAEAICQQCPASSVYISTWPE